jgi:hypothetical protein
MTDELRKFDEMREIGQWLNYVKLDNGLIEGSSTIIEWDNGWIQRS